jgi:hypothetical protein
MKNGHRDRDGVREQSAQSVQGSSDAESFRELLQLACREASADLTNERTARVEPPGGGAEASSERGLLASNAEPLTPPPPLRPSTIVGEVLATQHPARPGRVLVAFRDAAGQANTAWLLFERHLALRVGDRVLLTLPEGWSECIVTGALGAEPEMPQLPAGHERQVRLEPGEVVRFVAHDGRSLVTVRQSPDGSLVELGDGNVELKAGRTLRLSAETVEIAASSGIDISAGADTIVRGRTIRLN